MQNTWRWALTIVIAGAGIPGSGQESPKPLDQAPPVKSTYSLFHPTPRAHMREMNTDRPDQTESPYTVDPGHFQIEMDLVNAAFGHDYSGGRDVRTTLWSVAPLNLKVGLLDHVDLQFVLDTYMHSRVEELATGKVASASGFGDLQTRLKVNFWGNDGGKTAFGVMPFVKWPLPNSNLRNGKTEGGFIFPFALDLGRGWGLGAMTELDLVARDAGGYGTEFVNSITVGRGVTRRLRIYAEFLAVVSPSPGFHWQGQADTGWTYALHQNVQLDAGCNVGVTRSAPDFIAFVGLSLRR
jgi:hypothetical protein